MKNFLINVWVNGEFAGAFRIVGPSIRWAFTAVAAIAKNPSNVDADGVGWTHPQRGLAIGNILAINGVSYFVVSSAHVVDHLPTGFATRYPQPARFAPVS